MQKIDIERQTNKKATMGLIVLASAIGTLLTAYLMPSIDLWNLLYNIKENAMLRGLLIELIIRPAMVGIISIFLFYIGLALLKRLGIHAGCLSLLMVIFLSLTLNAILTIIQTPILPEWIFAILTEW